MPIANEPEMWGNYKLDDNTKVDRFSDMEGSIYISRFDKNGIAGPPPIKLDKRRFKVKEVRINIGNVGPADVTIVTGIIAAGAGILSAAIMACFAHISKREN